MNKLKNVCLALALVVPMMFVACDDDENLEDLSLDPENLPSEAKCGVITTENGTYYLSSVGSVYTYEYKNGSLSDMKVKYEGWNCTTSLSPFKFTSTTKNSSYVYTFKFTANGLISQMLSVSTYSGGVSTMLLTFSYNADNQIKSISCKGNGKEGSESYSGTASFDVTYGSKKEIISISSKENIAGYYETTRTFTFNYDENRENKYMQYTPNVVETFEYCFEDFSIFAYAGLFGNSSALLPSSIKLVEQSTGEDDYTHTDECSYDIDTDGKILNADYENYNYIAK